MTEERLYPSWTLENNPGRPFVNETFGITAGKKILNDLHYHLSIEKYSEVCMTHALMFDGR